LGFVADFWMPARLHSAKAGGAPRNFHLVEDDPESGQIEALGAVTDFDAFIDMIDFVWLQGAIGEMKQTVFGHMVWKNLRAVQFGIDGDDSVSG
jgi:hypothetical protein